MNKEKQNHLINITNDSHYNSIINNTNKTDNQQPHHLNNNSPYQSNNNNTSNHPFKFRHSFPLKSKKSSTLPKQNFTKQKLISFIYNNITLPYTQPLSNGSLFNLYTSDYFKFPYVIQHIYETANIGAFDFLINLILYKHIDKTFFYIPQICIMIILKSSLSLSSQSLENYLLDCCIDKIKFSLISYLIVNAFISKANDKQLSLQFAKLASKIETTLVNSKKQSNYFYSNNNNNSNSSNDLFTYCINKEYQIDCFNKNIKLFTTLKAICDKLKSITNKSKCNSQLKFELECLNTNITNMYNISTYIKNTINTPSQYLFKGYILPFDDTYSTNDMNNNIIVRFIPEYSKCYITQTRIPIKLVVECIRVYECDKWDELYNKQQPQCEYECSSNSNISENTLCDVNYYQFNPFGETYANIIKNIKLTSPFKCFSTYTIKSFIFKTNDDLTQESMIMQLIKMFQKIFDQSKIPLKLRPYDIIITSSSSGMIEYIPNTVSIDIIKKKILTTIMDLNVFFRNFFCNNFEEAQKNFTESLAAYSLITYILSVKDRHNGNILLDINGNIIHIDYGFVLGLSPGNIHFESAPFKLTQEYIDIMDGVDSGMFQYFKSLMVRGLIEIRNHRDEFCKVIEILAQGIMLPCFEGKDINEVISDFKDKFHMGCSDIECVDIVDKLINNSINNWRTTQYDNYQRFSNGIEA